MIIILLKANEWTLTGLLILEEEVEVKIGVE
jgi:hypothetical protein